MTSYIIIKQEMFKIYGGNQSSMQNKFKYQIDLNMIRIVQLREGNLGNLELQKFLFLSKDPRKCIKK